MIEQGAAFHVQRAQFHGGHGENIGVRFRAPPLLLGQDNFRGALPGVEGVDVRNDKVADGLLGTADGVQVVNVSGIIGGFDFLPGEKLPADNQIGPDLFRWSGCRSAYPGQPVYVMLSG